MTEMPPPPPPPPPYGGSYTPPASPLPRPPMGGGGVRIGDWFSEAFDRVKPAWVEYVIAGFIIGLCVFIARLACIIPSWIVAGPLWAGLFIFVAKKSLGMPAEIGDTFKGFRKFTETMLVWIVIMAPGDVLMILGNITRIIAMFGSSRSAGGAFGSCFGALMNLIGLGYQVVAWTVFLFALPLVLFRNMDAIGALKESLARVKSDIAGFALLGLASVAVFIVSCFGALLCGIGILVTVPLAICLVAYVQLVAYRDHYGLSPENLDQYR